jgi:hypothetical protein
MLLNGLAARLSGMISLSMGNGEGRALISSSYEYTVFEASARSLA